MAIGVPSTVSTQPNKSTLLELQKDVSSYIQGGDDTAMLDLAKSALNNAISRLNTREWNWSINNQIIPTDAAAVDYELASSASRPRHLFMLDTNGNECGQIPYFLPKEFMEAFPSLDTGAPLGYSFLGRHKHGTLSLSHFPSTNFVAQVPQLRFWYHAFVPNLDGPGDVLDAPPQFALFVRWYARFDLATTNGEPDFADRAERQWREAENRLIAQDTDRYTDWNYTSPFDMAGAY